MKKQAQIVKNTQMVQKSLQPITACARGFYFFEHFIFESFFIYFRDFLRYIEILLKN